MKDGGQAFPMHERDDALVGMTLRDYFAGRAMQAITSVNGVWTSENIKPPLMAQCAYEIADAMLAERAKEAK